MGNAASAISFQPKRLVPVSDHSPTTVPVVVPLIDPDDSSVEYTLTMKEAATLAYLWNVGLFPPETARPAVFELLFKSLRVEETSAHTQAMRDNLVSEILHAAKTGKWKPGLALTRNLMSSLRVKGIGTRNVTVWSWCLLLSWSFGCRFHLPSVIASIIASFLAICSSSFSLHTSMLVTRQCTNSYIMLLMSI